MKKSSMILFTLAVWLMVAGTVSDVKAFGGPEKQSPHKLRDAFLVSVNEQNLPGDKHSYLPSISSDGRFVVFISHADDLVAGDTNRFVDVFVHDLRDKTTERISVDSWGREANNNSFDHTISGRGRFVAFSSYANNLDEYKDIRFSNVFVRDRETGTTTMISVNRNGEPGNGQSSMPSLSSDGNYIAFSSWADNLVENDFNRTGDIFVYNRMTDNIELVSVNSLGGQSNSFSYSPAISADGRYVVFASAASNLVSGDTNNAIDVFVFDRETGITERVSVNSNHLQGNDTSFLPSISARGRFVTFTSWATNLVLDDTNSRRDVFVHDRDTGETFRISVSADGAEGNGDSLDAKITANGRFVAFTSSANNLVAGDNNRSADIFVYDMQLNHMVLASAGNGFEAAGSSFYPAINGTGAVLAFTSDGGKVSADGNGALDVYVLKSMQKKGPGRSSNAQYRH